MKYIEVDTDDNNPLSVTNCIIEYDKAISENKNVRAILLVNPHNPTGTIYTREQIMEVSNSQVVLVQILHCD